MQLLYFSSTLEQLIGLYGGFGEWGGWTECSKTCGMGRRARSRQCNLDRNGIYVNCTGELLQIENCTVQPCPGLTDMCALSMYVDMCDLLYFLQFPVNGYGVKPTAVLSVVEVLRRDTQSSLSTPSLEENPAHLMNLSNATLNHVQVSCSCCCIYIYKASQPRGQASGSRAYGRHEMQGVIFKCTRHECSVL